MISEKDMEDAIERNPERYLGEKGLVLIERQYRIEGYIFDLLFEDRHGAKLIVELQRGTLDRSHTYKILDYYDGYKEKHPNDFIELMVLANKIPEERKKRLRAWGVEFMEVPESEFISEKMLEPALHVSSQPSQQETPATPSLQFTNTPCDVKQIGIIDAILGAYPYSSDGKGLSAQEQRGKLQKAYEAKVFGGLNAFPAMHGGAVSGNGARYWKPADRTNRMRRRCKENLAFKTDENLFMLAKGVTPAELGVTQAVVDALATHKVIPHYNVLRS